MRISQSPGRKQMSLETGNVRNTNKGGGMLSEEVYHPELVWKGAFPTRETQGRDRRRTQKLMPCWREPQALSGWEPGQWVLPSPPQVTWLGLPLAKPNGKPGNREQGSQWA